MVHLAAAVAAVLGALALAQAACRYEQDQPAPPLGEAQYWIAYQRKLADEVLQADMTQVRRLALHRPPGGRTLGLRPNCRGRVA